MSRIICGIQQLGLGVSDFSEAWNWHIEHFGMDIRVFEEEAVANLMTRYTNGTPVKRKAALAMNMHGGGGFEIWQHKSNVPTGPVFEVLLGDLGIHTAKMKTHDVAAAYHHFQQVGVELLSPAMKNPAGTAHFYARDPFGNLFEFVEEKSIYKHHKGDNSTNGGVFGAIIGVSDIDRALPLYQEILGYDEVLYDLVNTFDDLVMLPGGDQKFRRVLLRHTQRRRGPFSNLLGPSQLELVTVLDRAPNKIFAGRMWGELGFIHLCFDVRNMSSLETLCESHGYSFTVNSANSFDMGVAAGHFAYIEDPDGTLIEFVETHKLPIVKEIGWYMNLKNRKPEKALPNWMVNTLEFGRVKTV